MPNPLQSPRSTSLGLLLARLPLGALFCIQGYKKLAVLGLANFVSDHIKSVPHYMPPWFPKLFLNSLPFAEMALGAFIILGMLTRLSALLTSALLVSFIMVVGINDSTFPFHPNLLFLGNALLLFFAGSGSIAVDAKLFGQKNGGLSKH